MRIFYFIIFCLFYSFSFVSLQAQAHLKLQEDAAQTWEDIYSRAMKNLRHGSSREKVQAAYVLGTQRNPRFLRPLLEELLKDLKPDRQMVHAEDSPHVKSAIAWAVGHIRHPIAIPPLLRALDLSIQLSQAEIKKAEEKAARRQGGEEQGEPKQGLAKVKDLIIKPSSPGPFLEHRKSPGFYYNGDKYWSLSDELQGKGSWLSLERPEEIARFGANYTNLARSIFIALGKISSPRAIEKIHFYLNSPSSSDAIRSYAGFALGDIGESKAVENLVQAFEKEKVPLIKIAMAYAILRNDKARFSVYKSLLSFLKMGTSRQRLAAARAFEKLAMGEALENLKAAYVLENDMRIRLTLERAIHNAKDNLLRVYFRPPSV